MRAKPSRTFTHVAGVLRLRADARKADELLQLFDVLLQRDLSLGVLRSQLDVGEMTGGVLIVFARRPSEIG